MITNDKFGFEGVYKSEYFVFKINTESGVSVKAFHKGQPDHDVNPKQVGKDNNTGHEVAVYIIPKLSAYTYEITDGVDTIKFEIQRHTIVWL